MDIYSMIPIPTRWINGFVSGVVAVVTMALIAIWMSNFGEYTLKLLLRLVPLMVGVFILSTLIVGGGIKRKKIILPTLCGLLIGLLVSGGLLLYAFSRV